ncbi:hypothetical protein FRC01_012015 [Tulasnella sp. 417]|nr:hypothetical protein FRC01_012015 [Tulasnella sp. 417]
MATAFTESGVADGPNYPALNEDSALKHEEGDKSQTNKGELAHYLTLDNQIRPEIVEGMRSQSPKIQLKSAIIFRRLTLLLGPPAEVSAKIIIDSGILPVIIDLLSSEDSTLVSESAWTIANMSAGTSEQTSTIVEGGAIPKLIAVFRSAPNDTKMSALLALGNILADSSPLRELVLEEGGLGPAADVLEDPEGYSEKFVEIAAWIIVIGTREDSDRRILSRTTKPIVPILLKFILSCLDDTSKPLSQAIKSLRRFVNNVKAIEMVASSGIIPRLVRLCQHEAENDSVQEDALRLLSRLTTGDSKHVQAVLDNGFIDVLKFCLAARFKVSVACWAVAYIARGTISQGITLLESPIIPLVVGIASDVGASLSSRQEAAKALSYAARTASFKPQRLGPLLGAGCIEALAELLALTEGKLGCIILDGIEYFIKTRWSGRLEAIARFEGSDGIRRLRDVRFKPWAPAAPQQGKTTRLFQSLDDPGLCHVNKRIPFKTPPTANVATEYLGVPIFHSGFKMNEELIEMELNNYLTPDGGLAPDIVGGVHSSNPLLQLESVTKTAQLLRSKHLSAGVAIRAVLDSCLLPNVMDMLSSSNAALVSEASSILLNITLGTSQQTSAAVSAGAIPKLVAASASEVEDVAHNALLALGNIAGDSDKLRDDFLEQRAFRPALGILADPSKYSARVVNSAAWIMESCAPPGRIMGYHSISTFSEAIPILCKFIQQKNKAKPLTAVIKALRRMCSSQRAALMILEDGSVPRLVQFCTSKNDGLREQALNLVAQLPYEDGSLSQSLFDNGVLTALETCITDYDPSRRLACFVASNIATANPLQAEALVKSSILPVLTGIVADEEEELKTRNEAVTTLLTLARKGLKNDRFFSSLVEADCVEACCAALLCTDWGTIQKSMEIIIRLIDTPWSGADDALERLEDSDGVNLLRKVWLEGRPNRRMRPEILEATQGVNVVLV